jgi:hypothetical protein
MTVDLSTDPNKRMSLNMRRASAACFALAVSMAVPFAPASAVVPAAPAWAQSAEINQNQGRDLGAAESEAARPERWQNPFMCIPHKGRL